MVLAITFNIVEYTPQELFSGVREFVAPPYFTPPDWTEAEG
jgi:hypothetical protein